MSKAVKLLSRLRRPGLLIRAARHGIPDYERNQSLNRLIDKGTHASSEDVLDALIKAEAEMEDHRVSGLEVYSISRHIELLVALMVEARHAMLGTKA